MCTSLRQSLAHPKSRTRIPLFENADFHTNSGATCQIDGFLQLAEEEYVDPSTYGRSG